MHTPAGEPAGQLRVHSDEGTEGRSHLGAHFLHRLQAVLFGGPQRLEGRVGLGQQFRRPGPHHGNAQGVKPSGQGLGSGRIQSSQQVLRGLLGHAFQVRHRAHP